MGMAMDNSLLTRIDERVVLHIYIYICMYVCMYVCSYFEWSCMFLCYVTLFYIINVDDTVQ